jgi:NDP-sugar pyrophosphorylase family protein
MKAIILAAGMGRRLKPLTDNTPKCLTEVNGVSILENMLKHLANNQVEETRIAVGYMSEKIKDRVRTEYDGMNISYTDNSVFETTNNSYSLKIALEDFDVHENLLILEGDVFFESELLKKFIEFPRNNSTIIEKYSPELDGSFVSLSREEIVSEWTHKTFRSKYFSLEDKYKTINIHKFSKDFLDEYLLPSLRLHTSLSAGKKPIEYVFHDITSIRRGIIHGFETNGLKWYEIDNLKDLKIAEEIFA